MIPIRGDRTDTGLRVRILRTFFITRVHRGAAAKNNDPRMYPGAAAICRRIPEPPVFWPSCPMQINWSPKSNVYIAPIHLCWPCALTTHVCSGHYRMRLRTPSTQIARGAQRILLRTVDLWRETPADARGLSRIGRNGRDCPTRALYYRLSQEVDHQSRRGISIFLKSSAI